MFIIVLTLALKYLKKNAKELGLGREQFYAGVNGFKTNSKTKQSKIKQKTLHSKFLETTRPSRSQLC